MLLPHALIEHLGPRADVDLIAAREAEVTSSERPEASEKAARKGRGRATVKSFFSVTPGIVRSFGTTPVPSG